MLDFVINREVLHGKGSLEQLCSVLQWYETNKVFLVAYNRNAEVVKRIEHDFNEHNLEYVLYDKVVSEPDLEVIDQGADICIREHCDAVVAVGGGSVIDTAKTIAMITTNGGKTVEYQLHNRPVLRQPLLFVAVPTTAGTGAEATKVSVVYNKDKGWKKSIYHTSMIAQVVILDPDTIKNVPPKIIASTGMDAITHAIESYISVNANVISRMYSIKALELLVRNIVEAYLNPDNEAARENMLLGSYLAGCAISAGTCLAHIVGQPVGAIYKIPHGDACSIYLIPSIYINMDYAIDDYVNIAKTLGVDTYGKKKQLAVEEGINILCDIYEKIKVPQRLTVYVPLEKIDIPYILDNIQVSMGHIKTNPRPVSRGILEELIRMAL